VTNLKLMVDKPEAMVQLGEKIARVLQAGDTVYLVGEIGAGKTTLARGIVKGLGYAGRVTSPTFTIVNMYEARIQVYHCDFYRLGEEDLPDLGLEDFLEKDAVVLVEWPEKMERGLPGRGLVIELGLIAGDYDLPRIVDIKGVGATGAARVEELKAIVGAGD